MAAFDANLMLRSTTQAVVSGAGEAGLYTGNWFTLGTGASGPAAGLTFRTDISTATGSNTQTLQVIYEFSDDQSVINETVNQLITGTHAGTGTSGGYLVTPSGSVFTRVTPKRNYYRARLVSTGTTASWGVVTIGVDAGDTRQTR